MTRDEWQSEAQVYIRMATYRVESALVALYDARKAAKHADRPAEERQLTNLAGALELARETLLNLEMSLEPRKQNTESEANLA
jgi:hypothetical protein